MSKKTENELPNTGHYLDSTTLLGTGAILMLMGLALYFAIRRRARS
ncbi:LPXTG cell wall anchor domain-containing protein [Bacillus sp. B1-b2]|nr:LPXTG cell wall anchor domain-containing protein [Bacillus sp. B1-b2]